MVILSALALVVSVVAIAVSLASARSSARSADEAAHSRADQLGPQVAVGDAKPLRERWNFRPRGLPDNFVGQPPGLAPVDRRFIRPANLDVRVLVGAYVSITNEGSKTAIVTVDTFRADRCDDFAAVESVLSPTAELPSTALKNGQLSLAPGQRAGIIVRQGPSLAEWIENHPISHVPRLGEVIEIHPDRHVVDITAQSSPDGATQHWRLEMVADVLADVFGNAAEYRVVPHVPPGLFLSELPRTYPPVTKTWATLWK
jgi:hypothetical protein